MTISIPAAGLIATGLCTGGCLLALDDDCDCRCAGRFHGRLTETPVEVEQNWGPKRAVSGAVVARSLLGDVLAVIGDVERMHSARLCVLLGQRWADDYSGWTPTVLARALLEAGVRTRQICERTEHGGQTNRRGVYRTDVAAAIRRARRVG